MTTFQCSSCGWTEKPCEHAKPPESREERYQRLAGNGGWIGVDLDATLAEYRWGHFTSQIGPPIAPMLERVKGWLSRGWEVRIFTARAATPEAVPAVEAWCEAHVGKRLVVTNVKDGNMIELWDDRVVQVVGNLGHPVEGADLLAIKYQAALLAIQRAIKKSEGGTVAEIARIAKEALG